MIIILAFWFYSLCLCFLYGWFLAEMFSRLLRTETETLSFPIIWLTGLSCVVTLAGFFSLIEKTGLLINILILAGALCIIYWGIRSGQLRRCLRQMWAQNPFTAKYPNHLYLAAATLLSAAALFCLLILSAGSPANPDSGIYHAQAIRWIESYKAVPGLGNIHTRLAYNSSWMLANALFSFSFLSDRSLHLIGSSLALVTLLFSLTGLFNFLQFSHRTFQISDIAKLLLLPFLFTIMGSEVSSPGSDMPAALIAWIIIIELLSCAEQKKLDQEVRLILITVIASFAVTVKLSHFPLLLVAVYPLFRWGILGNFRKIGWLVIASGIILLPWLARNVILSGYVVYPYPEINIFQVDWKIPPAIAHEDKTTILSWTKPWLEGQNAEDVLSMPLRQWAPIWFDRLTPNRKFIITVAALSPFSWFLMYFQKRSNFARFMEYLKHAWFVFFWVYICLLFWFLTGPAFRFGYGFIIPAVITTFIPLFLSLTGFINRYRQNISLLTVLLLLGFQAFFIYRTFDVQAARRSIIMPADYPSLPTKPCEFRNITLWCAEYWEACWYDPFPCVTNPDASVGMRGEKIEDGFSH